MKTAKCEMKNINTMDEINGTLDNVEKIISKLEDIPIKPYKSKYWRKFKKLKKWWTYFF